MFKATKFNFYNFFATYFRRVVLTYMESETYPTLGCTFTFPLNIHNHWGA